jgi:hypothetical protein
MHGADRGSDQAFDVATVVRRAPGAVLEVDAMLLTATLERPGPKLCGIVEMQSFGDAKDGIVEIDLAFLKPGCLWQDRMADRHAYRRS